MSEYRNSVRVLSRYHRFVPPCISQLDHRDVLMFVFTCPHYETSCPLINPFTHSHACCGLIIMTFVVISLCSPPVSAQECKNTRVCSNFPRRLLCGPRAVRTARYATITCFSCSFRPGVSLSSGVLLHLLPGQVICVVPH